MFRNSNLPAFIALRSILEDFTFVDENFKSETLRKKRKCQKMPNIFCNNALRNWFDKQYYKNSLDVSPK
jgi:hypothetical protein